MEQCSPTAVDVNGRQAENLLGGKSTFENKSMSKKKVSFAKGSVVEKKFTPDKKSSEWAKNCVICGTMGDIQVNDILKLIHEKGFSKTQVSKLATDTWVLISNSQEERDNLLKEEEILKKEWVSYLRNWKDSDHNGRRRIWLSVYGVPLHVWSDQFFKKIGNIFGKIVQIKEETSLRKNLEKGRILIDTPIFDLIRKKLNFRIWDMVFEIYVVEDCDGDWKHEVDWNELIGESADSEISGSDFVESDEEDEKSDWREWEVNEEGREREARGVDNEFVGLGEEFVDLGINNARIKQVNINDRKAEEESVQKNPNRLFW